MNTAQTSYRSHSNRYSSDRACEHCEGIIRHETWCITNNEVIRYAYQAVLNAESLAPVTTSVCMRWGFDGLRIRLALAPLNKRPAAVAKYRLTLQLVQVHR
jgi:hypothetical protein